MILNQTAEAKSAIQASTTRYGVLPNHDTTCAYDIANLIVPMIRKHGYNNTDAVLPEVTARGQYKGLAAEYMIDEDGGVSPEISRAIIRDGKFELSDTGG